MSEKIPTSEAMNPTSELTEKRHIPLDSFVEGEKVDVPLLDAELVALRDRTIASLRKGVDEATQKLLSSGTSTATREEAERILKIQIGNLAQVIGWKEAEQYGEEVKERYNPKENMTAKGGTSGSLSKTARVLRSLFSSF